MMFRSRLAGDVAAAPLSCHGDQRIFVSHARPRRFRVLGATDERLRPKLDGKNTMTGNRIMEIQARQVAQPTTTSS
jgi:hypothetical protein